MSSDLPLQELLQQMNARRHSGEHLEVLGKKAAAEWGAGQHKTLTEAVVETVKQAQLSPEQVRRVIEFANTAAYLEEFNKEGAPHRVVNFAGGPADPAEILKDLNDGGGGSLYDRGTGDYDGPPGETKVSSAEAEEAFRAQFGATESPLPYENPYAEIVDLKDKLAGAGDHLHAQISGLEVMYADLGDRLYHQVKQAALSGISLGEVMQAWESVAPSEEHVKVGFTLITPRLLREGVFHDVGQMTASVDKLASAKIVNTEHPLVTEFSEFCTTLSKLAELREARREVAHHLSHLTNYLKTASLVGKTFELSGRAGKAARPLLNSVAGETAGGIGQTAIHAAPAVAAAVGANELNKHIENSPGAIASAARTVKHKTLQQIPGTPDYYAHLQRIQYGY